MHSPDTFTNSVSASATSEAPSNTTVAVPVLKPSSADVLILLIYLQLDILTPFLNELRQGDPRSAGADTDDPYLAGGVV